MVSSVFGRFFMVGICYSHYFFTFMNANPNFMAIKETTCKNCEQIFDDAFNYCPYCGQNDKEELTIGVLFSNTIANYFSVDARFFKSFWPLMAKPGYLARKFLAGKRLLYLHPAQMYLFVSVVFFFLFSFVARNQEEKFDQALKKDFDQVRQTMDSISEQPVDSAKVDEVLQVYNENKDQLGLKDLDKKELDSIINAGSTAIKKNKNNVKTSWVFGEKEKEVDSLIQAGASDEEILKVMGLEQESGYFKTRMYQQGLKFYRNRSGGSLLKAFYDSLPIAMFFLLPLFALILKVLYYNKGRYAHHLVFSFYFFAFVFVVFSILVLVSLIWAKFPAWANFLIILSTFFYLMIALKRFYGQGWFLTYIKTSIVATVFGILMIPASILLMMFAFMFY